jgi:hypothetical protein
MELALAVAVGVSAVTVILGYLAGAAHKELDLLRDRQHDDLESLRENLNEKLQQVQLALSRLEDRLLSPAEKVERRFYNAPELTLRDVQQMRRGHTYQLMSRSFHPPSEEPCFISFEYKHDHLEAPVDSYVPVRGFARWDCAQEWTPYEFLVAPDGCITSDHAAIRRLVG